MDSRTNSTLLLAHELHSAVWGNRQVADVGFGHGHWPIVWCGGNVLAAFFCVIKTAQAILIPKSEFQITLNSFDLNQKIFWEPGYTNFSNLPFCSSQEPGKSKLHTTFQLIKFAFKHLPKLSYFLLPRFPESHQVLLDFIKQANSFQSYKFDPFSHFLSDFQGQSGSKLHFKPLSLSIEASSRAHTISQR